MKLCLRTDSPLQHNLYSVQYHSLPGTISFRVQRSHMSVTSKVRLNGVLGQMSMYETFFGIDEVHVRASF
jgi:hypothetical protein